MKQIILARPNGGTAGGGTKGGQGGNGGIGTSGKTINGKNGTSANGGVIRAALVEETDENLLHLHEHSPFCHQIAKKWD
jgi:hypothetical protein